MNLYLLGKWKCCIVQYVKPFFNVSKQNVWHWDSHICLQGFDLYVLGVDPVAVLRWTIVKTLIKSMFAFLKAGKMFRARGGEKLVTLFYRILSYWDILSHQSNKWKKSCKVLFLFCIIVTVTAICNVCLIVFHF